MAPRILVVDQNKAFATMLKEMLETDGGYEVEAVHVGSDALDLLRRADFDLTIVDMDLGESMDYRELVEGVRHIQPTMRLMLIPLMGEGLPAEAQRLDIQGTLSKPFFADDLLPSIQKALTKQVRPPAPGRPTADMRRAPPPARATPPQPAEPRPVEQPSFTPQAVLSELARETNADSVLLLSGKDILAHVGALDSTDTETLAELSLTAVGAAQAVAHFLGQPDEPFKHNMFEGGALRLYIMTLPGALLLVVVTPINTPLGTIRHNLRRAVRSLAGLALT